MPRRRARRRHRRPRRSRSPRGGGSPRCGRRRFRFHVGDGDCREQQRDADAVVQAALDVEALADPRRDTRLGHDCLTERGVGRRQDDREDERLLDGQLAEEAPRRARRARSSAAARSRADAPGPRPRDGAAGDRSARRRRTGRARASPRPAVARSRSSSRGRFRRGPRARPADRPRRTPSLA